ncbi:hypothetical protein ACROYT_G035396 [Oculina patagonica]
MLESEPSELGGMYLEQEPAHSSVRRPTGLGSTKPLDLTTKAPPQVPPKPKRILLKKRQPGPLNQQMVVYAPPPLTPQLSRDEKDGVIPPRGIVQERIALFNRGEIDALNEKIGFLGRQLKLERKDREMKILNEDVPFLEQELAEVEQERNEMQTRLAKATQERNSLENQVAELQELVRYQEEFYSFRIEEPVDDAEMPMSTLKAKISLLKRACKEKDELVDKLCEEIRELRHFIATSALDDMSKIRSYGYSPENFVELSAQREQERDPEDSVEESLQSSRLSLHLRFDYDPYKSPACEHPELELKLKEGNFLTVFGDMDINGYFEADVNGVRGLVPSLYMTEVEDDNDSDLALEEHLSSKQYYHTLFLTSDLEQFLMAAWQAIFDRLKKRAFIWYQIKISTVLETNWPGVYLPPAFWVFLLVRK